MKRALKVIGIILISLFLLLFIALNALKYKTKYGIRDDQTERHDLKISEDRTNILIFSKTTGWRHGEAIDASKKAFDQMAEKNDWSIYDTEDAGIIHEEDITKFDAVIWNNSTGVCLTDNQRIIVENYVKNGGALIGIHGSGDFSHHWDWYRSEVIGAIFSHHSLKKQIQTASIKTYSSADSLLTDNLPSTWDHDEEWYIFHTHPEEKGFTTLLEIDGTAIDTDGNLLWMRGMDFGMGKRHPVAWYKKVNNGKTFYTSLGHQGAAFDEPHMIQLLENAINWSLN